MFITKREFEKRIKEAKDAGFKEAWQEQRFHEQFRLIDELTTRLNKLEGKPNETERPRIV